MNTPPVQAFGLLLIGFVLGTFVHYQAQYGLWKQICEIEEVPGSTDRYGTFVAGYLLLYTLQEDGFTVWFMAYLDVVAATASGEAMDSKDPDPDRGVIGGTVAAGVR